MSLLILAVSLVSCTVGSYTRIKLTDEHLTSVLPYLDRVIPLMFPEAQGPPTIQRAEMQIVAGYNLRLHITIGRRTAAVVVIYVNPRQVAKLTSIQPDPDTVLPGGWHWHDVTNLDQDAVDGVVREIGPYGFTGTLSKVLAFRTQVVAGLNTHIIFTDQDGNLHAALVYQNPRQQKEVVFYRAIK
jgi:hypothetical protein